MKTGKLVLAFLTCASGSVLAQSGAPECGVTNFDQRLGMYTVINAASGAVNQQCFLTLSEGNYEILLSGGGGGGGGGSGSESSSGGGGQGGAGALQSRTTRYLQPGVYRLTMGTGGLGGGASHSKAQAGNGANGNPTGMAEAHTGETIAGFPSAEQWAGQSYQVAAGGRGGFAGPSGAVSDGSGPGAVNGANGGSHDGPSESGFQGGHGYIKLTQLSQAPQAVVPAPAAIIEQPKPELRPIKKDRN